MYISFVLFQERYASCIAALAPRRKPRRRRQSACFRINPHY